jgi:hypothetical protein
VAEGATERGEVTYVPSGNNNNNNNNNNISVLL